MNSWLTPSADLAAVAHELVLVGGGIVLLLLEAFAPRLRRATMPLASLTVLATLAIPWKPLGPTTSFAGLLESTGVTMTLSAIILIATLIPLDFSNNLSNIWIGPEYESQPLPFGFGIRHDPRGDNRFVPWFNAPLETSQELGLFLLISNESTRHTLDQVARLTRSDRFEPLPGHTVFSNHYHVEHTRDLLEAQKDKNETNVNSAITAHTPTGGEYLIPKRLQNPGFVRVFREMGVNIVHLAEFHFGTTPRMNQPERLRHLELLHAECRRLSDEKFLLLPGEEPNVHLGGHWISFFPKPIYWDPDHGR